MKLDQGDMQIICKVSVEKYEDIDDVIVLILFSHLDKTINFL